ncbi:MAG: hypothetical protein CME68_10120 [Halobacteriovoraceae bacterium]|nr:hypothetical protein [Halobacteriovoraceae bacterium]
MAHSPLKSLGKDELIDLFEIHNDIATSLLKGSPNKETFNKIIEKIMEVTSADGATLYLVKGGNELHFEVLKNKSFKGDNQTFDPIPLSTKSIATDSLNQKETIIIDDAYLIDREWDVNFNKALDKEKHYRTRSVLAVPLIGNENSPLGVLQLVNKKNYFEEKWPTDPTAVSSMPAFSRTDTYLTEKLGLLFSAKIDAS